MEQTVRVIQCASDGTAQVLHLRQSACSGDCHKCGGCGAAEQKLLLTVENPIGAKPGDEVVIASRTGPVLGAAVMLYVVPLVLFIGGYILGESQWGKGPLTGLLGFLLALILAGLFDRLILGRKKIVYTIIGYHRK